MTFYPLEKLSKLRDGYRQSFSVNGLQLLLLDEGGKRYLLENSCPHMGKPLTQASLTYQNQGIVLRCPHHGLQFDLQTGALVSNQANCRPLKFHKISYEDKQAGIVL